MKGFQPQAPFAASLFVEVRKRMGQTVFDEFHETIIDAVERRKERRIVESGNSDDGGNAAGSDGETGLTGAAETLVAEQSAPDEPQNHGKLIVDASVVEQAIRYPTDLGLLNEARELSERIINELHAHSSRPQKKKPRTYREVARKAYLSVVKLKRPSSKRRRAGIRQQLQFLRRNLGHIGAANGIFIWYALAVTQLAIAPLLGFATSV